MAGYKVIRTSERKGKTHKVIGPDGTTKYFGDPNLKNKPNNPEAKSAWYARHAKSLKDNPHFRAYARETWAEGGYVGGPETEEEAENMAQGGKLDPKDDSVYITKDGKRTERGLWANVYMKKKREGKLAEGGEVEEPEKEQVETPEPMEQPRLEVPEIKVPEAQAAPIAPLDMSLAKQERTKLAELPEVESNKVATSQAQGGGGGGGILGKILGFLFGGGADGGLVPMHFAEGGVSLTPEDMDLMKRKVGSALMPLLDVPSAQLRTSSVKTGDGSGGLRKKLAEAEGVGAYAEGGNVGSFAALTNAIGSKPEFPEPKGGNDETEGQSVPLKKPVAMANGGTAPYKFEDGEGYEGESTDTPYFPETGDQGLDALRKDPEYLDTYIQYRHLTDDRRPDNYSAEKQARFDVLAKKLKEMEEKARTKKVDTTEPAPVVATDKAPAAATDKVREQPTDAEKAAGMSLVDRGGGIVARLLATGAITPDTAEKMSKDFLAGDKPGLYEKVKAGIDKRAADKELADAKAAADKVAADEKAKADALARETPLEKLDRLATEARDRLAKEAAPSAPVASTGATTSGGGGDTAAIPTTDKLMADSVGALSDIPAVGKAGVPQRGKVNVAPELLTALENPATRYTDATFNAVSALSSRPGEVYNLALRSGYSKDDARKMAIDQGATELTAPRLPTLPSAEDAMKAARESPEIAAYRQAQARAAAIKLRDTQLATAEAAATAELRTAQNDLALKAAQDQEVRMAALTKQRDDLRNAVYNDTINLDRTFADIKAKQSFGFMKTALAFLGTSMGGTVNPYAIAKSKINEEMNTQLQMVDRKRTLLGELIQEGNSMEDAYAKTQARLKLLFGFQMQKAAAGLRDERARLAGLADANKLIMEGAKEQHDMLIKDVNARYEPYRIKLQGDEGKLRDVFEYLKQGGDMEALRQKMASDAADRGVRREEIAAKREDAALRRAETTEKTRSRQMMEKLLAGQPLADSREYALVDRDTQKQLVRPINVDEAGNVRVGEGYLLARDANAAKTLSDMRVDSQRALGLLDRMQDLLAANRYNYRAMSYEDQGKFKTARDEFIAALGSKAARNVGVPSDKEFERLADAVPEPGYFNIESFARGKLDEFRRVIGGHLKDAYDANLFTPGGTPRGASANIIVEKDGKRYSVPRENAAEAVKLGGKIVGDEQ